MAARALLHEGLLVWAVQLLGELDGLQGCQASEQTVAVRGGGGTALDCLQVSAGPHTVGLGGGG